MLFNGLQAGLWLHAVHVHKIHFHLNHGHITCINTLAKVAGGIVTVCINLYTSKLKYIKKSIKQVLPCTVDERTYDGQHERC